MLSHLTTIRSTIIAMFIHMQGKGKAKVRQGKVR